MSSVCHSNVSRVSCHSYVTRIYSYVTRMSSVCHSYVLICHSHVTRMYSRVIRMSLVCSRMSSSLVCSPMSSVCHSYVLVCHPMSLVCGFTMNRFSMLKYKSRAFHLFDQQTFLTWVENIELWWITRKQKKFSDENLRFYWIKLIHIDWLISVDWLILTCLTWWFTCLTISCKNESTVRGLG